MGNFFGGIGALFNLIFMQPIFNGLTLLYHLFGDFGLSIVVLTLIIKLVLFPLTLKQLKSMKANQALQPKIQEIRKKYAKDQQAQMLALQGLYKEYGVSPLSGCLPMLVQLPVLYGLYYALSTFVNAHTAPKLNAWLYFFVPHFSNLPDFSFTWFQWLSFLNPILHVNWSWTISLIHPDPSHVLPIVAALATFVQLRMSQPKQTAAAVTNTKTAGAPDPTAQTMKTMQFVMPVFILFIGWNFTAGLVLYWIVSSLFQAVQQYFVTGWGSLLTTPSLNIKPKDDESPKVVESTLTKNETSGKNRNRTVESVEDDEEVSEDSNAGPVSSKLRTTTSTGPRPGNGTSAVRRQQRGNSASARRRSSNNTQRSRR